MCLDPETAISVPSETARIAHASFPKGNIYMKMRDELGVLYEDPQFADLFPPQGQPAEAPWRLAMTTIMQFAEGLSDRQAADAVRSRIDWKYAQGLELTDPGFDASVLCEFRARLLHEGAEARLFEILLARFAERKLLKVRGRQRTDSTHVLAAVRSLNRLECLGETLRYALNSLAEADPQWLTPRIEPVWFDRYGSRLDNFRLPQEKAPREALALTMGTDGFRLLDALWSEDTPPALRLLPAVQILRQIWLQQFYTCEDALCLRTHDDLPPGSLLIVSPYDVQARFCAKRQTRWMGYKVHLTETCDEDAPHLVTQVLTTASTTSDREVMPDIQSALAQAKRLPAEHLVDTGYTQSSYLVDSQRLYSVELLGPLTRDGSWQTKEEQGYDLTHFLLDWQNQRAVCPEGKQSPLVQSIRKDRKTVLLQATFKASDCRACASRADCTRSKRAGRTLYLHLQAEQEALQEARLYQQTPEFRNRYAARAGIEGTLSQGVRAFGMRRSRYVGHDKTHLQNLIVAAAMNFCRVYEWLIETPMAKTRKSHFQKLNPIQNIA